MFSWNPGRKDNAVVSGDAQSLVSVMTSDML